jgi:hypothetical protein
VQPKPQAIVTPRQTEIIPASPVVTREAVPETAPPHPAFATSADESTIASFINKDAENVYIIKTRTSTHIQ